MTFFATENFNQWPFVQVFVARIDHTILVRCVEKGSHQLHVHIVRGCVNHRGQRAGSQPFVHRAASRYTAPVQRHVQSCVRNGTETRHQFVGAEVYVRPSVHRLFVRSVH